jgi:hypothetical protein
VKCIKLFKIVHYARRVYQVGPKKAYSIILKKMQTCCFENYKRLQTHAGKAAFSWSNIAQRERLGTFSCYVEKLQKRSFIFIPEQYEQQFSEKKTFIKQADEYVSNCFDLLGSGKKCFTKISWHKDFRLKQNNNFDVDLFYKDCVIQFGKTEKLVKDIKVPWELSRFNHALILGTAFEQTGQQKYAKAFVNQVLDWIKENPYLLGPNWVCPMDVGIRALNWVVGFEYCKTAEIDEKNWQTIVESLYNHLVYLENNWETGSKTSNHYLSDLIGYFALTWFFTDIPSMKKRQDWCYKELLVEFEKQVQADGTDYEGSTSYHKLVTEIYYLFYLFCQENNMPVPDQFVVKLQKMFEFIDWSNGTTIGDDDSGKILIGVNETLIKRMIGKKNQGQKFFPQFGLSVFKTDKLHVTLRHHVYQKNQPSGHFHNDANSITLAVDGIPVIVDLGSYLYTASSVWRNRFRSVQYHNTFFFKDKEPVPFDSELLFQLDLPEQNQFKPWIGQHNLYGITAERKVDINEKQGHVTLLDSWQGDAKGQISSWNFTLAPDIVPEYKDQEWHLNHKKRTLLRLHSADLNFTIIDGWYAPNYGTKVACKRLMAEEEITQKSTFTLTLVATLL